MTIEQRSIDTALLGAYLLSGITVINIKSTRQPAGALIFLQVNRTGAGPALSTSFVPSLLKGINLISSLHIDKIENLLLKQPARYSSH